MSASAHVNDNLERADGVAEGLPLSGAGDLLVESIERAEATRIELLRHREKASRLEQENALLNRFLEDARRDFRLFDGIEKQLTSKVRAQESEIRALRERIQSAESIDPEAQRARQSLESELRRARASEASLQARCKDLESEASRLRLERESLAARISAAEERLEAANSTIRALQGEAASEEHRIEKERDLRRRQAEFSRDERRLRHYAVALRRERQSVLDIAHALHNRLQESRGVNPVKDYLEITEFETRKVEIRLKTMPTLSPERPALESAFSRMVEQRDFLRKLVAASEKEAESHADALKRIIDRESSASVPPPPPKVRDA